MFKIKFTNSILLSIVLIVVPRQVYAGPIYQGMSLPGWSTNAFSGRTLPQTVSNLNEVGANTVSIVYTLFQDDRFSSDNIRPEYNRYSVSPSSVNIAIDAIHSQGMQVMLKPHLDFISGGWRGEIDPRDPDSWFAEYQTEILRAAKLAADKNVDIFCIGTELNGVERYEEHWRSLIAEVRKVYHGKITYAANHSPSGVGGGYEVIRWWDDVDYIGIDAYFPTTHNRDSVTDFTRFWQVKGMEISRWRDRRNLNQPVIFTEVGLRSLDGAARYPWDWQVSDQLDLSEQANYYEGLLSSLWNESWWEGAFWWAWETDPTKGGINDTSFTPQGKPAELILEKFYLGKELLPGDANQDYRFDQLDIIQILTGSKYLSGLRATWGEGDWNGAPGGILGLPPAGDNKFDQLDIIAALNPGHYLSGPYGVANQPEPVPEPAAKILLLAGILLLCRRSIVQNQT